jgi:hypothetical protein
METSFWSVSGRDHLDPAACINKPTVPPGGFLSTKITYAFKQIYFLESAPFYVVPSVFSIFLLQDVMRSDPAKEHPSRLKLKSASVVHSHRTLFAVFSLDSLDLTKCQFDIIIKTR